MLGGPWLFTVGWVAQSRSTGTPGSELWVSDNGAMNHVTSYPSNVYHWVEIPPGNENVLIGSRKEMRGRRVGSLNLNMHAVTDFNVKWTGVYVTEGTEFNLFSLYDAESRQNIALDKDGVNLFIMQPTFPRSETGSHLHATRIAHTPTPITGFTAVSVISGGELSPPPPVTVSHPLSLRRAKGVVPSNVSFPPTGSGEVGVVSSMQVPPASTHFWASVRCRARSGRD